MRHLSAYLFLTIILAGASGCTPAYKQTRLLNSLVDTINPKTQKPHLGEPTYKSSAYCASVIPHTDETIEPTLRSECYLEYANDRLVIFYISRILQKEDLSALDKTLKNEGKYFFRLSASDPIVIATS